MSGIKKLLEENEANHQWAISILLDAGALEECEFHGYLVDQMDIAAFEDAVATAIQQTSDSEEIVRQKLQDVLNEYGDECPGCESNAAS